MSLPSLHQHLYHFAHLVLDWNPALKPEVAQRCWRFPLPEKFNDTADEQHIDSPGKRRQFDTISNPLEGTQLTPPPSLTLVQPRRGNKILKTPRPDITMGLRHSSLIELLVLKGVDVMQDDDFLKSLQVQ